MLDWLRSILFLPLYPGWTALVAFAAIPVHLLPRRAMVAMAHLWLGGLRLLARAVLGIRIEIRGRENLPPPPFILACRHESALDTFIPHLLCDDPAFVMKRELLALPLVGWHMRRTGQIGVDRAGGASALRRMLREAEAVAAAKRPLVIFPEGTRMPPGETRKLQPGLAALADHLRLPVVPVAVHSGQVWPRRGILRRSGTAVFEILPALPATLRGRTLVGEVQTRFKATSGASSSSD